MKTLIFSFSVSRLALAVSALLAGGPTASLAATNVALADAFYASYPSACGGGPVLTGLCVLASTSPQATGAFKVGLPPNGGGTEYAVALNTKLPLAPGSYLLYRANGLDSRHALRFTVTPGSLTTVKTATVKFQDTAGRYNKLQHFQAVDGINGVGCNAEIGSKGVGAYLPGAYQVSIVAALSNLTPKCQHDGVAFNVMSGEAVTLRPGALTAQKLAAANIYQHPTKAISLTNIDHLRHDVSQVGFLSKFQSINGIHNPSSAAVDALVLSGAPNFHFVIPVKMNATAACGTSLASGGLPSRNLMSACVFDGNGYLTRFQVNAGAYFSFDNIYAKSAVAGHTINSPFIVSGVKFNLKGN
ncbi:MAG: hypothetical protein ACKN9T_00130 [Candidatus Methylumidiphilus sp.]